MGSSFLLGEGWRGEESREGKEGEDTCDQMLVWEMQCGFCS